MEYFVLFADWPPTTEPGHYTVVNPRVPGPIPDNHIRQFYHCTSARYQVTIRARQSRRSDVSLNDSHLNITVLQHGAAIL